ncbi:hypothetical protein Hanom_Chr10g00952751 [Helianthus anomalus]
MKRKHINSKSNFISYTNTNSNFNFVPFQHYFSKLLFLLLTGYTNDGRWWMWSAVEGCNDGVCRW